MKAELKVIDCVLSPHLDGEYWVPQEEAIVRIQTPWTLTPLPSRNVPALETEESRKRTEEGLREKQIKQLAKEVSNQFDRAFLKMYGFPV